MSELTKINELTWKHPVNVSHYILLITALRKAATGSYTKCGKRFFDEARRDAANHRCQGIAAQRVL